MSDTDTAKKKEKKDVKDMTADELRSEVWRLQHKVTDMGNALKAKQVMLDHMRSVDAKRQAQYIVDAIERMLPIGSIRRL